MLIALTGALARLLGGDYGQLAQGVFLILALGVGGLLFASARARAWLSVMISKHFFEHRYDYRAEWMRFTATLAGQGDEPTFRRIARALAELAGSPGALILTADADGNYCVIDHWQWPSVLDADNLLSVRDAFALQESGHIVDLDALRHQATADEGGEPGLDLPRWLIDDARAWVLLPLLHMGRMVGLALLHRPIAARALDWEDLDVLRISGRQAASHIAEMQSQAELSEARRFDEFNRRFAFIMHDVKNLASQLGLLAANAERHAENPEFRADMIETLKLSVARMNELLLRLSPQGRGGAVGSVRIKVAPLLQRIMGEAGRRHPVSTGCDDGLEVSGDQDAILQILGHLVTNAIEASDDAAPVLIAASADGEGVRIDVIDHGAGMSREFIRNSLFKPFVSTKDNGFGLGAFEALQLARAMHGRLDVDSREGEGSRFSLWLPRAAAGAAGTEKDQAA
jgi:putative PEP-CTERM system histidine kinase